MTENEAMTLDEAIAHAREVAEDKRADCIACAEEHEQLAKWLEELRLYRAIGTPEQILANFNDGADTLEQSKEVIEAFMHKIEEYEAIGTVEEVQNLKADYFEVVSEWRQYRKIGTVTELQALKEKAEPKKATKIGFRKDGEPVYECGCCGNTLKVADQPYCMICGCKVDWS